MLEIMVVVIIISILSVAAITQYTKTIERQHGRNAVVYLKAIRSAQLRYYLENDDFASNVIGLDIEEVIVEIEQYFDFSISPDPDANGFTATAERKGDSSAWIKVDEANEITTGGTIYEGIY